MGDKGTATGGFLAIRFDRIIGTRGDTRAAITGQIAQEANPGFS